MNWCFLVALVALCHVALSQNSDSECGKNMTNLWLDVVIVADVSREMTNDRLWQVPIESCLILSSYSCLDHKRASFRFRLWYPDRRQLLRSSQH